MGNFRNRGGRGSRGDYRSAFNRNRTTTFVNPSLHDDAPDVRTKSQQRAKHLAEDATMGFTELAPGSSARVGWLVNMVPGTVEEPSTKRPVQAVDLFFICDDGGGDFRASIIARPYMYLGVLPGMIREAEMALRRKFGDVLAEVYRSSGGYFRPESSCARPWHTVSQGGGAYHRRALYDTRGSQAAHTAQYRT